MKRILLLLLLSCSFASATIRNVKNSPCNAVGDGVADDTAAVNTCIDALVSGDTLLFPSGTYKTVSALHAINISNITVDGSSAATVKTAVTGNAILFLIGNNGTSNNPHIGSAFALSGTASEGATSFTTTSNMGVIAGNYVFLKQGGVDQSGGGAATACDPSGCRGQLLKVASVSGNTVNVSVPLNDTYSPSVNSATATQLITPLTGITVKNITFDGSGGANTGIFQGFMVVGVVDSTFTGITSKNVQAAAINSQGGYNNTWKNITITGAGSASCGGALDMFLQANILMDTVSLSSLNPGAPGTGCLNNGAFGFLAGGSSTTPSITNSTFLSVSIDAAGTGGGRPFKLDAAKYNVFYNLTVTNGCCAFNGLAPEYYSSHNAFDSCTVTNNGGAGTGNGNAGINSFGNYNTYNTYSDCTLTGNGNVQWFISNFDFLTQGNDGFNTLNRGTYTGSNSSQPPLYVAGVNPYITGATINGSGPQGLLLTGPAANGCVNNNTFSGTLTAAISSNGSSNVGSGNTLNGKSSNLTVGSCSPGVPTFSPSPSSLTFAAQTLNTTSLPQTITVTNNGTGGYNLTSYVFLAGTNPTDFTTTDNCHSVLAGGTCTITITFTPTVAGSRSATLTTRDNTLNATNTIAISGTGGTPSNAVGTTITKLFSMEAAAE